uniref:Uncharacterized protein n=1 Tax=Candidatus Methanophagaceae archaeon ANME-1 ERB6 TaxID=2759912 RepID=A0A7G9Z099_9EURY|nr:hypothetical protein DJFKIEJF_00047 [Methanosarcinales archaeon ANME-1 ERB6]
MTAHRQENVDIKERLIAYERKNYIYIAIQT